MRPGMWLVATCVACSMMSACAQGDRRMRTFSFPDTGTRFIDAGRPDAGRPDAGPFRPMDAGPPDAGPEMMDAGNGCAESPCTLTLPQCGCEEGDGCYIDGTGIRMCLPAGRVGRGVRCGGTSSCQPGHLCVGSRSISFCHPICDDESDCPGTGSICTLRLGDGRGGTIPGVTMCSAACDPTSPIGCPTGAGCHPQREDMGMMRFYTHCVPAGPGGNGDPCTDTFDCRAGFTCSGARCTAYCLIGGFCPAPSTCRPFTGDPVIIEGTQYGICS